MTAQRAPFEASTRAQARGGVAPPTKLTELLWGLRFADHLPHPLSDGVVAVESTLERAAPFIRTHYPKIFAEQADSAFRSAVLTPAKERYYEHAGDVFEIQDRDTTIGLVVCNAVDWSTYYVRSAVLLPEYQGRRIVDQWLRDLFVWLAEAGVERVEAEASPSNSMTVRILTRLGFMVTGTTLTERFGALTRFTRFLDAPSEAKFQAQFCAGSHPRARTRAHA